GGPNRTRPWFAALATRGGEFAGLLWTIPPSALAEKELDPTGLDQVWKPPHAGEPLPPVETQRGDIRRVARDKQPPAAVEDARLDVPHQALADAPAAGIRADRQEGDEPAQQKTVRRDDDPRRRPPAVAGDPDVPGP